MEDRGVAGEVMGVLARILESKRTEIAALRDAPRTPGTHVPIDVVRTLRRGHGPLRLIAEIKRRSPSAGPLSIALSPAERAVAYARAGASMISVLCDGPFFDGAWSHLAEARAALDAARLRVPLLAKEFVLDARQIQEARDRGADAVLLIARIVDAPTLATLAAAAVAEGLEPLVEIVNDEELEAARAAKARVVGVNARDLDTLAMDADRTARLLGGLEAERVAVHLSGIKGPEDVARVASSRTDAALLGEALMKRDDPAPLLQSLVAAAEVSRVC